MGKKIASTYYGLCVLTVIAQTISCFITWHNTLFHMTVVPIFRMQTGLLTVKVDVGAKKLCKFLSSKEYCEELEDGVPLQSAAHDWCAPLVANTMPSPCHALSTAYYSGLMLFILYIINVIMLSICCYLVYHYMESRKHKANYRHTACGMHCVITLLLVVGVICYSCLATVQLDTIGSSALGMVLGPSQGPGVGYGLIGFCFSLVLQMVGAGLFALLPLSDEYTDDERMEDKFNKESAMLAAVMNGYGSADQAGNGQRPVHGISQQQMQQQQMQQHMLQQPMQQYSAFQGESHGFAEPAAFGLSPPGAFAGNSNAYSDVVQVQVPGPSPVRQVQPPFGSPQSPAW